MTLLERFEAFRARGVVTDLDLHFARFIARLARSDAPELALAACLASHRIGTGHVCVDLAEAAGHVVLPGVDEGEGAGEPVVAPPLARWTAVLRGSGVVGQAGDDRPLVLDGSGRLYLHRYWRYEHALARALRERAGAEVPEVDLERLRRDLVSLFPPGAGDGPDWQRVAAVTAVLRRLCVISGGPGTGKTTTVIRILALLLGQTPEGLVIALAAPTGKAAARMQEAIRAAKERVELTAEVRARIPDDASTIHRLLGARPGSARFRHDRERPLAVDALVVDEASMIDLALMAKLVDALPPTARLIVLGDRDQLASVEAGAVLGDVCGPAPGFSDVFRRRLELATGERVPAGRPSASPLRDTVVLLTRSYRFAAASGIGRLATAVNRGDGATVLAVLGDARADDVGWRPAAAPAELAAAAVEGYGPYLECVRRAAPVEEIFAAFRRFQVLCAHRRGPSGVETVNRLVDEELRRRFIVDAVGPWFVGRPILVTQNDYTLGLFNGDLGVALPDPGSPERLRVVFETEGGVRHLPPVRLPAYEPVWAMTVHKSQGSEFDHVLLVLPNETSPLMTRELLYTGVTRARTRVEICGDEIVLLAAVERGSVRSSGLRDALWSA
ncbi:MAG: exodeoxyribonuclease V subunit alpha [Candidatus Binatia bacterium]